MEPETAPDKDNELLNIDAFLEDLIHIVTGKKIPTTTQAAPGLSKLESFSLFQEQFNSLTQKKLAKLGQVKDSEVQDLQEKILKHQMRLQRLFVAIEAKIQLQRQKKTEQALGELASASTDQLFENWLHNMRSGISEQIEHLAKLREQIKRLSKKQP
jgi:hypothetical protein